MEVNGHICVPLCSVLSCAKLRPLVSGCNNSRLQNASPRGLVTVTTSTSQTQFATRYNGKLTQSVP